MTVSADIIKEAPKSMSCYSRASLLRPRGQTPRQHQRGRFNAAPLEGSRSPRVRLQARPRSADHSVPRRVPRTCGPVLSSQHGVTDLGAGVPAVEG